MNTAGSRTNQYHHQPHLRLSPPGRPVASRRLVPRARCHATETRSQSSHPVIYVPLLLATLLAFAGVFASPRSGIRLGCAAELDPRIQQLSPTMVPSWDNLEGAPQWLQGEVPFYSVKDRMHVCHLPPGRGVKFLVPPRAMIRLVNTHGALKPGDVEIWLSNGSGLYQRQTPIASPTGDSWIVAPHDDQPCIAHVFCPKFCGAPAPHTCKTCTRLKICDACSARIGQPVSAVTLGIFTSRYESTAFLDGRILPLQGCGAPVRITEDPLGQGYTYHSLVPGQLSSVEVCGPVRLRVRTRFMYQRSDTSSSQHYLLRMDLDGISFRSLESLTQASLRQPVFVDGRNTLVSADNEHYVSIPEGVHRVGFSTPDHVYLRVESLGPDTFAHPHLHGELMGSPESPQRFWVSAWDMTESQLTEIFRARTHPLEWQELAAYRMARDNRYRNGGLDAAIWFRNLSAQNPDRVDLHRMADRFRDRYSRYTELMPVVSPTLLTPQAAWFTQRRLAMPGDASAVPMMPTQFVGSFIDTLSRGHFVPCPRSSDSPLEYRLPTDHGATWLRVAVDRSPANQGTSLFIQFDGQLPHEIQLAGTEPIGSHSYEPSVAERGLSGLACLHPTLDAGTHGGPFTLSRPPGPRICAATAEIPVPEGVSTIHLWASCVDTVRVALHLRTSRPDQLTESRLLTTLKAAPCSDFSQFHQLLLTDTPPNALLAPDLRELRNHYEALYRRLRSHSENFDAGAIRVPAPSGNSVPAPSSFGVSQLLDRAAQDAKAGQWLSAVEAWSQALPELEGSERRDVLFARIEGLIRCGEQHLATMELRGLMIHDLDATTRTRAFEIYTEMMIESEDWLAIEHAAAACLVAHPNEKVASILAEAMAVRGDYEDALLLSLLIPEHARPLEVMLIAAYQLEYWLVFDSALTQLGDLSQRNLWLGMRRLRGGQYAEGLACLAAGGREGEALARHWRDGMVILQKLNSNDPHTRLSSVFEWERWIAETPGHFVWKSRDDLVTECDGTDTVRYPVANTTSTLYRATPEQPVKIAVLGPIQLQINVRPLRLRVHQLNRDDWLHVQGEGKHFISPLDDSGPAPGVELVGRPGHLAGRLHTDTIELGPGRHEFSIWCDQTELLVQFQTAVPELPLPVLPPLTTATLRKVVAGPLANNQPCHLPQCQTRHTPVQIRLLDQSQCGEPFDWDGSCGSLVSSPADDIAWRQNVDPLVAARIAQRLGDRRPADDALLQNWAILDPTLDHFQERVDTMLRFATHDPSPQLEPFRDHIEPRHVEATWMQWNRVDDEKVFGKTPALAKSQLLAMLVHRAETDLARRSESIVKAFLYIQTKTAEKDSHALRRRVLRNCDWTLFDQFQSSAGVHRVELNEWSPESPALRARKALMEPHTAEHSLAGHDRFTLDMNNTESVDIAFQLHQPSIGYLQIPRATVQWKLDQNAIHQVELDDLQRSAEISVPVPPGVHHLSIWLRDPVQNQIVLFTVSERSVTSTDTLPSPETLSGIDRRRSYHVATRDEPLEWIPTGPTVLRVDTLSRGSTRTKYIPVLQPSHTIVVRPEANEDSAHVRVYQLAMDVTKPEVPAATVPYRHHSLPRPWADEPIAESTHHDDIQLVDAIDFVTPDAAWPDHSNPYLLHASKWFDSYPLGHQEDGTWSIGGGWVTRRALEEGLDNLQKPDTFWQVDANRLFRDPWTDRHVDFQLLARMRNSGGTTLGYRLDQRQMFSLNETLSWLPGWTYRPWLDDLQYHGSVSGYIQEPGSAIPPYQGQTEAAGAFLAQLARSWQTTDYFRVRPSVTFFGRVLSMDQNIYPAGFTDQDIFTEYKNDQRVGWQLGPTATYQPTPDRRWWLQSTLSTNEDFNVFRPDFWAWRPGGSQIWGPLQLEYSYRYARYFQDDDRSIATNRHQLDLHAMVEQWRTPGFRWELTFGVRHEIVTGGTSGYVQWHLFRSHGRGYRDVHASDSDFLDLKRSKETWNRGRLIDSGL